MPLTRFPYPRLQYDFFDPQPVYYEGVGAFFLRHMLHNWDDADCVRILRNLRSKGVACRGSRSMA
ncbi:unnamed protein product [Periconia digitata]|uniref:O-methyltransferase domain-containing protein n=1 Tax=Periconia digitata TaxID=1303443 RepID=A0A9W4US64_9PLEO|nr:unnamed protein product [Periconia digitata]